MSTPNLKICHSQHYGNIKGNARVSSLYMGPVSTAVVLYVAERLLTRLVAGQLLRKGIARKMRRLGVMLIEWHLMYEVVCDLLDDIPY
jgi:hypothetical protein